MKCMYAQTRPRFILSSEGVFGGMEFEPMLTPREKSPLPKKSPEEDRTCDAVDSEPKHYQLSYSTPTLHSDTKNKKTHTLTYSRGASRLVYSSLTLFSCLDISLNPLLGAASENVRTEAHAIMSQNVRSRLVNFTTFIQGNFRTIS